MEISFTCRTVPVLSLTFLGISEARSQFLLLPESNRLFALVSVSECACVCPCASVPTGLYGRGHGKRLQILIILLCSYVDGNEAMT